MTSGTYRSVGTARYLDPLEVERIELHAFGTPAMVTSFRTAKLESWVVEELAQMAGNKAQVNGNSHNDGEGDDQDLIAAQTVGDKGNEDNLLVSFSASFTCCWSFFSAATP